MIGIITTPSIKSKLHCETSYVYMSYIHWVEMAGETAVIIPYNTKPNKLIELLQHINGVIWVGGSIENKKMHTKKQEEDLLNTLFATYQYAISENNKGNYYPIWATCLGMYIIVMFVKELGTIMETIHPYNKHGLSTCTFTHIPSRIKTWFSAHTRLQMKKQACLLHNHTYGINSVPEDKVRVVSVQDDHINILEFVYYPFYGVHFHPEQPQTEFAINISNQFISFFVNECRKNKNKWKWKISDFEKKSIKLI